MTLPETAPADERETRRVVTRSLHLPGEVDVARLLAAGWSPVPGRLGWWREGADAPRWWLSALRAVALDEARWDAAAAEVDALAPTARCPVAQWRPPADATRPA